MTYFIDTDRNEELYGSLMSNGSIRIQYINKSSPWNKNNYDWWKDGIETGDGPWYVILILIVDSPRLLTKFCVYVGWKNPYKAAGILFL